MDVLEIIKQFDSKVPITDAIICLAGILIFGSWLLKTSLGRNALANSAPRRNNMPLYLPFVPLLIWFGAVSAAISITRKFLAGLPGWQSVFLENLILCIGAIATMIIIIFLVRGRFARRLKGFGLNPKTIFKDFFAAMVNLLSALPLVMLAIILTTSFGKLMWGQEFEMQKHQELELITAYPQLSVRVLIIITAVVIVPVFEEMLFRGLFQTMIRSLLSRQAYLVKHISHFASRSNGAWLSIVISSGLFAMAHQTPGHWPALFSLSICMGYAYEKSGSLFRPIFIHSFFNAISITAALNQ